MAEREFVSEFGLRNRSAGTHFGATWLDLSWAPTSVQGLPLMKSLTWRTFEICLMLHVGACQRLGLSWRPPLYRGSVFERAAPMPRLVAASKIKVSQPIDVEHAWSRSTRGTSIRGLV